MRLCVDLLFEPMTDDSMMAEVRERQSAQDDDVDCVCALLAGTVSYVALRVPYSTVPSARMFSFSSSSLTGDCLLIYPPTHNYTIGWNMNKRHLLFCRRSFNIIISLLYIFQISNSYPYGWTETSVLFFENARRLPRF